MVVLTSNHTGPLVQTSATGFPSAVNDAIALLQERLLDSRSVAAQSVPLREGLQKLHNSMCVTMREAINASADSNNASFLVIGDHGSGKTLVSYHVTAFW